MNHFRQAVFLMLPQSLQSVLRSFKARAIDCKNLTLDRFCFSLWLVFLCTHRRKRVVIIRRMDALGDVVCTLPMCMEIRQLHPERLIVFITTKYCESIVLLSRAADCVYSARSKRFTVSSGFLGLVEKVYDPQTTDERSDGGSKRHLLDDLAASCGVTVTNRQPRLYPSPELLQKVQAKYGLDKELAVGRLLIAINCGPTWRVREWDVAKWQMLMDRIHAEYDAVIIQFGTHIAGKRNEYDDLKGVQSLVGRLVTDELVALIASSHLLVAIDSGPVHIAGAVGTPVVGLFGAVDPRLRLPPDSPAAGLFGDVPCLFCHHKTPRGHWMKGCPNDIRCMKELDVQPVFLAVKAMLAKRDTTTVP